MTPKRVRKTFHFEPNLKEVLTHLKGCEVCLSRLLASVCSTPADAAQLLRAVRLCVVYSRDNELASGEDSNGSRDPSSGRGPSAA